MTESDYILTIEYALGDAAIEDAVQGVLFLSSCLGSTIGEREGRTLVEAYFANAEDRSQAEPSLETLKVDLRREERPRVDWLQLYKQSLKPIEVGKRLVIVPDGSMATSPDRLRLVIPQERAFGTGSHESTSLCLELLEQCQLSGARCLDVGTGSGILAIAMVRLGARKIFALDNDFETFGIVGRNLVRNNVPAASVRQFFGELAAVGEQRFGAITMNIIPEVIGPLLREAVRLLEPSAPLIVSGVTLDRRAALLERAEAAGLAPARECVRGEWWAADLRTQGTAASSRAETTAGKSR